MLVNGETGVVRAILPLISIAQASQVVAQRFTGAQAGICAQAKDWYRVESDGNLIFAGTAVGRDRYAIVAGLINLESGLGASVLPLVGGRLAGAGIEGQAFVITEGLVAAQVHHRRFKVGDLYRIGKGTPLSNDFQPELPLLVNGETGVVRAILPLVGVAQASQIVAQRFAGA